MFNWFQILGTIVACFVWLGLAIVFLVWPQAVRDWFAKRQRPISKPWSPWNGDIRTQPLWHMRMNGVVALMGGIILLVALIMDVCKGGK